MAMTRTALPADSAGSAVDDYVFGRRSLAEPISTAAALKAVRAALPTCALTDGELAGRVAASAIRQGRCVDFDEAV